MADDDRQSGVITRSGASRPIRRSPRARTGSEPPRTPSVAKPQARKPLRGEASERKPDDAIAYMADVRNVTETRLRDARTNLLEDIDMLVVPVQTAQVRMQTQFDELKTEV